MPKFMSTVKRNYPKAGFVLFHQGNLSAFSSNQKIKKCAFTRNLYNPSLKCEQMTWLDISKGQWAFTSCKEELRDNLGNPGTYQVFATKQTAFPEQKVSPPLPRTCSEGKERKVFKEWPQGNRCQSKPAS
jgi:hypothetical protein